MRATVIISEYLFYIPPIIESNILLGNLNSVPTWETSIALVAILLQPSTILIDHAHFQYNTLMLGFAAASICKILSSNILFSSAFFVLALSFKQMALYYAPAIIIYLLCTTLTP